MKKRGISYLIRFITVCIALTAGLVQAGPLSDADKQFLARYEDVRSALAADDLGAARMAASDLGNEGATLVKSGSLKEARAAFEKRSDKARQLAAGQSGFYVVHCPMLQKDWVQTNEKIANPYYGKEMATCGEIKNKPMAERQKDITGSNVTSPLVSTVFRHEKNRLTLEAAPGFRLRSWRKLPERR